MMLLTKVICYSPCNSLKDGGASMTDVEGIAWAREVFGEVGPHIRSALPQVLTATHSLYAAHQVALGLSSAEPYGLMWLGVPKALVEQFSGIAGVQTHRPRYGRYLLPVINGVPLIPWRYAKDRATDIDQTPFGHPLSTSKKSLFEPLNMQPELPLGEHGLGDAVLADLQPEQRQELNEYGDGIRALATESRLVAVLAYASNPEALLTCYYGYAQLGSNDLLTWTYREELALSVADRPIRHVVTEPDARPAFNDGVPAAPVLRPRSPLEPAPTPEPPLTPQETGSGD
jgi:hypothetical protein